MVFEEKKHLYYSWKTFWNSFICFSEFLCTTITILNKSFSKLSLICIFVLNCHSFIKAFEYIVKILACKTHDLARCFKILRENTQIQNMGSLHSLVHVMNPLHALVCVMNPLHTLVSVMNFTICSFSESIYSKAITNECNYCLLPSWVIKITSLVTCN